MAEQLPWAAVVAAARMLQQAVTGAETQLPRAVAAIGTARLLRAEEATEQLPRAAVVTAEEQ